MALKKTISIGALKSKNEASQQQRAAEKAAQAAKPKGTS